MNECPGCGHEYCSLRNCKCNCVEHRRRAKHEALLELLSTTVEPYLRRVQEVVEETHAIVTAHEVLGSVPLSAEEFAHVVGNLRRALADLPTSPLERVRAACVEGGASLPGPGEGTR